MEVEEVIKNMTAEDGARLDRVRNIGIAVCRPPYTYGAPIS